MNNETTARGRFSRERRERRGLTQGGLARAAGVSASMICRLEAGTRRPTPGLLLLLAEPLQVPYRVLLRRAGYQPAAERWQAREATAPGTDPLAEIARALDRGPWSAPVRTAIYTLLAELAHNHAAVWQRRFDEAVAELREQAGRAAPDTSRAAPPAEELREEALLAGLRQRLFGQGGRL